MLRTQLALPINPPAFVPALTIHPSTDDFWPIFDVLHTKLPISPPAFAEAEATSVPKILHLLKVAVADAAFMLPIKPPAFEAPFTVQPKAYKCVKSNVPVYELTSPANAPASLPDTLALYK